MATMWRLVSWVASCVSFGVDAISRDFNPNFVKERCARSPEKVARPCKIVMGRVCRYTREILGEMSLTKDTQRVWKADERRTLVEKR